MYRLIFAAALIAALPWSASAQVEKQVEVTKAYVPSVESAAKLAIEPDMTDTVMLRPEIDYTITPLSLRTTLSTRPIRPATVTYWEFNRPLPVYLKIGAGYPSNSVLDFYASSQNPSTGYVIGYVNHRGRYADIRNEFRVKNKSWQMQNRAGVAAGKYLGRHVLEGEIAYDNRIYHRYGRFVAEDVLSDYRPGARVMYDHAAVDVRFGDDFHDLRRLNFEVALHGTLFMGNPKMYTDGTDPGASSVREEQVDKSRQISLGGDAKIARAFGRHRFEIGAGYEWLDGQKRLSGYEQQQIRVGLRYGIDGDAVRLEAGADYYYDKVADTDAGNYLIPYLRLAFNLGTNGLKPFIEFDGGVRENSFAALSRQNPYLANGLWDDKSSVDYNGRLGIGGSLWRDRFTYRVHAGFSIRDHHPYWYTSWASDPETEKTLFAGGPFLTEQGRQTVTSIHAQLEYRPVSVLRMTLGVHGFIYNDEVDVYTSREPVRKVEYENGEPSFEADAAIRYEGRKVAFGVGIRMQNKRNWTVVTNGMDGTSDPAGVADGVFTAPFAADLSIDFDWKLSRRVTLFAEGRNLLNRKLYEYAWYPEYGANFTLGIKANF